MIWSELSLNSIRSSRLEKGQNPPLYMLHNFRNAKYCPWRTEMMEYWKNFLLFTYFVYSFKYYKSIIEYGDQVSETNIWIVSNKHLANVFFPTTITKFHQEDSTPSGISSVKMTLKFINAVAILIFLVAALFIFLLLNAFYQGYSETCMTKSKNLLKEHLST